MKRRSSKRNTIAKPSYDGPAKIPGVCVAHVGGLPTAVAEVRDYWRDRAASFVHHSGEAKDQPLLERTLDPAHIVFLSEQVSPEIEARLESYLARTEKPLIVLEDDSVAGVSRALESSWPRD